VRFWIQQFLKLCVLTYLKCVVLTYQKCAVLGVNEPFHHFFFCLYSGGNTDTEWILEGSSTTGFFKKFSIALILLLLVTIIFYWEVCPAEILIRAHNKTQIACCLRVYFIYKYTRSTQNSSATPLKTIFIW